MDAAWPGAGRQPLRAQMCLEEDAHVTQPDFDPADFIHFQVTVDAKGLCSVVPGYSALTGRRSFQYLFLQEKIRHP
ncbi:MAG: hypothetical protein ABFD98_04095 [Syntrophobacteraceae bacterium]